ncbi:MAG: hypothetical protein IKG93_04170 [Clostridiales bacterium]|nr:hypothetical protein [Clostridiales bacterium]
MIKRRRIVALIISLGFLCGCKSDEKNQYDPRDEVRKISTTLMQSETSIPDTSSIDPARQDRLDLESWFFDLEIRDDLLVLNDSSGKASVYRIRYEDKAEQLHENGKWEKALLLSQYTQWFSGMPIDHDLPKRFEPPEDIWKKTMESWEIVSVDEFEESISLPDVANRRGNVFSVTFDFDGYPQGVQIVDGHSFVSNKVKYIETPYRIDGIPVGGTGFTDRTVSWRILEWSGVFSDTPGTCLETMETFFSGSENSMVDFVSDDAIVHIEPFPKYTIIETIMKNVPIISAEKALDSVKDAVGYVVYQQSSRAYVFAMELAYICVTEYDEETRSFPSPNEAVLMPVWVIYFYEEDQVHNCGFNYAMVNAVNGESLYSKKYSPEDAAIIN